MRVAITGGIAEGKSTVLSYIAEMGHEVASADAIARAVFHDPEVNATLASFVGGEAPITPQDLRTALMTDSKLRRQVNRTTHPEILSRIEQSDARFFEVPLLIEACLYGRFDAVWVVTCGPREQMRRLVERYGSDLEAERILATQLSTLSKTPFSDLIIRTNEEPESVRQLVEESVLRVFSS